ncbi:hypothetical protein CD30_00255 [Ureibacillus massiliensis 4400831 = CIP 108448 = CCUG 49529]|uniref:ABC transmembrane type-1 domain-containing protein n=1 Tax=Ureibacillus massiliensis 4400831 = CIP 108448 = CCUG 49529 TaxID=1211035 RepID=A0A0A3JAX5_9BACL|nr:ABC transporter permease subunit [Ureibacillus massiliensis]KGR92298.1 hypothetical protein CD30_00255 [Ureibacillus massiliensis 4400831 = CIP 108448 = CCUG 49529]
MPKAIRILLVSIIYLFILGPILIITPISFTENMFQLDFSSLTLKNYQSLFSDSNLLNSLWLTFIIAIIATFAASIIGIFGSLGIVKGQIKYSKVLENLFLGPLIIPYVTTGIGLMVFFVKLELLGTVTGIILAHIIIISPYIIRICIASLKQMNPFIEEAAIVHGASTFYMFRTVVLPQLLPATLIGGLLAFLVSIDEYTVTVFLADADTITLPIKIFQYINLDINPIVTALSTAIVIVSIIIILISEKFFKIHQYIE